MSNSSNDNSSFSGLYAKRGRLSQPAQDYAEALLAVVVSTKVPYEALAKTAPDTLWLQHVPDGAGQEILKEFNLAVKHLVNAKNMSTKLLEQVLRGES